MKLGFFRKYDLIWKGALGPFSRQGAIGPFLLGSGAEAWEADSSTSVPPASAAKPGPFPAKLIVGVRAPIDPETGMSVSLPLLDRKAQDLLRLLSFSAATDSMPEVEALLANLLKRLEAGLKAESTDDGALQVFHLELRVLGFAFRHRDGVYSFEKRVRSAAAWPAGYFMVDAGKAMALREVLRAATPRTGSSDLDQVLQLSQLIDVPLRYRDWRTRQVLGV